MIQIEAGGEYRGETYIWCDVCAPWGAVSHPARVSPALFEGKSMMDFCEWMIAHIHPGPSGELKVRHVPPAEYCSCTCANCSGCTG